MTQLDLPNRVRRLLDADPKRSLLLGGLVEREHAVRMLLLAALAGEHALLIGPPGTAKSLLARRLRHAFRDASYFEVLLTQFSIPDELFGPYRLSELDKDNFVRNTQARLPQADVAFLDEIFKANPAILNSLLTILNERLFANGDDDPRIPLKCLVGASNEIPEPGELDALYDRFLVRLEVGYVDDFLRLLRAGNTDEPSVPSEVAFAASDLDAIAAAARAVDFPLAVDEAILACRKHARELGWAVSDRRWLKARKLVAVAAVTRGASVVSRLDLAVLLDVVPDLRAAKPTVGTDSTAPADLRARFKERLLELLWDPTPSSPGMLPKKFQPWADKLEALSKAAPKNRKADDVRRAIEAVKQLEPEIAQSHAALHAEAAAWGEATKRNASHPWLEPALLADALARLDAAARAHAKLHEQARAVKAELQKLDRDLEARVEPPRDVSRSPGKPTPTRKPKPRPYLAQNSLADAQKNALAKQQEWLDYLGDHPILGGRDRELEFSFTGKRGQGVAIPFLLIPPGTNPADSNRAIEHPFLLGKYHVTREEWFEIMGTQPFSSGWTVASGDEDELWRLPADRVSWNDCCKFCNTLSGREKLTAAYTQSGGTWTPVAGADGYRLPTEWEWEYACRAGTKTKYWCGDSETDLKQIAWYDANAKQAQPVDSKDEPNPFGLVGMHGNLWQWCSDVHKSARTVASCAGVRGTATRTISRRASAATAAGPATPSSGSVFASRGQYPLTLDLFFTF